MLADADADGDLDVIVSTRPYFGGTSAIVAIDEEGAVIWTRPLDSGINVTTAPVAGDFDLDGVIDIAYGTSAGTVEAISCEGDPPNQRWAMPASGSGCVSALGLADVDSDGLLEIVVASEDVSCINAEDGSDKGWSIDLGGQVVCLAIDDTDVDGEAEVFAGSAGGRVGLIDSGVLLWTREIGGTPGSSAAIADVDGNAGKEILVGSDDGYVHVLTLDGDDYVSPMPVPGTCLTPFASDLTGDGTLDVAVCTSEGTVYAFDLGATAEHSATPEWLGVGGTASRTSVLEQPFWGTFDGSLVLSGNFRIVGDVVISSGSTLTIAAGARLAFDGSGLEISGTLHAPGTPGSEITMTGSPASRSSWKGIEARPGASLYMSSCVVSDAVLGLEARSAAVTLVDCEFAGNETAASIEDCSFYASGTSFSGSDGIGLYLEGGAGTVVDCLMDGNGTAGLSCVAASAYKLAGTTFCGTTDGSGASFSGSSHCVVDSCSFLSNAVDGAWVKQSSPKFSFCQFSGNGQDGINCEKLSFPDVRWCSVTGNRIGVACRTASYPSMGNTLDPESGYNSVYGNQQAALANYNTLVAPLQARRNWWGAAPPAGRIFIGYVLYTPWLSEVPSYVLHGSEVPEQFASYELSQNRPNPFNPVTTLAFSVPPSSGRILLTVYDSSGRLVRTLHDGPTSPGQHEVVWDGRDDLGNRVASGVYFARMVAPDFGATRKMLLLK